MSVLQTPVDTPKVVNGVYSFSGQSSDWTTISLGGRPKSVIICSLSPSDGRTLILNPNGDATVLVNSAYSASYSLTVRISDQGIQYTGGNPGMTYNLSYQATF